jgi:hypothetical protein
MYKNFSPLDTVFGIEENIPIWFDEEDFEPVFSNWRGRPGMHSKEGREIIVQASREFNQKQWRIYREDGSTEDLTNLEKWCNDNGHNSDNVRKVGKLQRRGYIYRSYKGIIKVDRLDKPSDYNPWKWVVTFKDGRSENIFSLNKWCKFKGHNAGALVQMSKGKLSKYKDIGSIFKL